MSNNRESGRNASPKERCDFRTLIPPRAEGALLLGGRKQLSSWTFCSVILIRAAVCHWVMGLIRLEPRLECGVGGSAVQNSGFVCPPSFPVPHPSLSMAQLPCQVALFGGRAHTVLAAGEEAEPGSFLAVLPREAAGAAASGGSCGRAFCIALS